MPIPKPTKNEDKQHFISRCISKVSDQDPDRSQKQITAICYDTWRKSRKENEEDEKEDEEKPTAKTGEQRVVISSKTR